MENVKTSIKDVIWVDDETCRKVEAIFDNALYDKFLGKASPLELVRSTLLAKCEPGEIFTSMI